MNLKVISCNVFLREVCHCIARSPHIVDVEFTELGEHVNSQALRARLQERVDAADSAARRYDAVLLCFGLCGNATVGLAARSVPLVLPRAHDCCAILLGSREVFREHFADHPSTPFSSAGYVERGEYYLRTEGGNPVLQVGSAYPSYVEQYGEENAKYIWESLHPDRGESVRAVFIDVPETRALGYERRFREAAAAEGRAVVTLPGSLEWLRRLIHGEWEHGDVLVVPPGQCVTGVYDWTEVMRAAPPAPAG